MFINSNMVCNIVTWLWEQNGGRMLKSITCVVYQCMVHVFIFTSSCISPQ